jgi:hypothetical protein
MTQAKKMIKTIIRTRAKKALDSLMTVLSNGTFAFVYNKSSYPRVGAKKNASIATIGNRRN